MPMNFTIGGFYEDGQLHQSVVVLEHRVGYYPGIFRTA